MLVSIAYWKTCRINWESFDEVAFLDSKKLNWNDQLSQTQPTNQPVGLERIVLIHHLHCIFKLN